MMFLKETQFWIDKSTLDIMKKHVFIPECCMLSEEAANTHVIGKLGWSDKIYHNEVKHANHDITEADN
jgi:hypothetical protein